MNIGFVSVWSERGAGYVTRTYLDILKNENSVFVYARGGETTAATEGWNQDYITWGKLLPNTRISWGHFKKWIENNHIDVIFFNEQRDFRVIYLCHLNFPNVKLGSYIDYYKIDTVENFKYYDFLICNTNRHYSAFKWHKQAYYIPWGTDTNLYSPVNEDGSLVNEEFVTFFHSVGMATRKGTDVLLDVFINTDLYMKAKLVIHTQRSVSKFTSLTEKELKRNNVVVIEKTVQAPGLYYMGDVYVYPTTLDGLGLTIYEALSSGLPVITSDNGPMNEIIDDKVGSLVNVNKFLAREDGYYWPLCFVDRDSLYESMKTYINYPKQTIEKKKNAREKALAELNLRDRENEIKEAFYESKVIVFDRKELLGELKRDDHNNWTGARIATEMVLPVWIVDFLNRLFRFLKNR